MPSPTAEYVEYVVSRIVGDESAVTVTEDDDGSELTLEVDVPADQRGRVIGRGGRVIRSLRVLARASAGRNDRTVRLDVIDPEDD